MYSESQIGEGGERRVSVDPENPDKLKKELKEDRPESAEKAKARFYLTKIMHEIFPKNIPDIHQATSAPNTITVERRSLDEGHKAQELYRRIFFGSESVDKLTPELAKRVNEFNRKLIQDPSFHSFISSVYKIGVDFDAQTPNFGYDEHGQIQYIDSFQPWSTNPNTNKPVKGYDSQKLEMEITKFDAVTQERLLSYLQRLESLYNQELLNSPNESDIVQ
jgi:hypothetical protein